MMIVGDVEWQRGVLLACDGFGFVVNDDARRDAGENHIDVCLVYL